MPALARSDKLFARRGYSVSKYVLSVALILAHVTFFNTLDAALSTSGIESASTGVALLVAATVPGAMTVMLAVPSKAMPSIVREVCKAVAVPALPVMVA